MKTVFDRLKWRNCSQSRLVRGNCTIAVFLRFFKTRFFGATLNFLENFCSGRRTGAGGTGGEEVQGVRVTILRLFSLLATTPFSQGICCSFYFGEQCVSFYNVKTVNIVIQLKYAPNTSARSGVRHVTVLTRDLKLIRAYYKG